MKILSRSTILMADPNTFVFQPLNLMMGEKSGAETPLCLSSSHNPKSLPNVNPGEHFNLVKVKFNSTICIALHSDSKWIT